MKNKKLLMILAGVIVLALGIGIGAYAASNYGTQDDPLVAKSYIDNVLTPQLKQEFQSQVDQSVGVMEQQITAAADISGGNFASVSLASGKTLAGEAGCQIILRTGSVSSTGTGVVDVTDGTSLSAGSAVTQNHLLTVATSGDGVTASGATTLLVLGSYTIK